MGGSLAPPVPYFGGKQRIAERIVALLPEHGHYVEPYCGGLSVLMAKPLSKIETVNDLDGDLMTFWRVLRDRPEEFERVCALTPHGRAEHAAAHDRAGVDDLELARRVWVRLTQGRGGGLLSTGWRYYIDPEGTTLGMSAYLRGYVARFAPAVERLQRVSLEARPALELIEHYGQQAGVLFYVDPPYLGTTRNSTNGYRHEMKSEGAHRELLEVLRGVDAAVVLSGYDSAVYSEVLRGWDRVEIAASTGQGSVWGKRTEVLWSNRPFPTSAPGLFDIGTQVGDPDV